jgi:Neurotransmitter-gated ion-channel ligand binding domain
MRIFIVLLLLFVAQIAAAQQPPTNTALPAGSQRVEVQPEGQPPTQDLTSLPLGKGLPVMVRVGLYFQSITAFDDNEGTFTGTVDMRLRWEDPRLRYPAETTPRGFQEYRGPKADQKLKEVWVPGVAFTNLKGSPSYQTTSLRIFPSGWVEVMQRTTGQFTVPIDSGAFPFDKQTLGVEVTVRRETTGEASLVVLQEDIDFSRPAQDLSIDGWTPGLVNVKRYTQPSWYGEFHSGLVVGLTVARNSGNVVASVFIPLLASLLIPLLAIWMNSTEEGEFVIDAFELANVIVGGLFAVIALNFTINAAYSSVATGDNTVTRLFGLNYVTLGLGLTIVVLLYRYNVPMRLFGRYVQEQIFSYLSWAVPLLAVGTALAFILVAAS